MTVPPGQGAQIAQSRAPLRADPRIHDLEEPAGPFSQVSIVGSSESTNTAVAESLRADDQGWPHMSALVANHQTQGRGRAGRGWETPAGAALTVSVVLRLENADAMGWVPLAVGLAASRAIAAQGVDARIKWPNDIVVLDPAAEHVPGWGQWRKLAGILCELVGGAVVAGVGVNVSQAAEELPVAHATSLALAGGEMDRVELLGRVGLALAGVMGAWRGGGDADAALAADVAAACVTLGEHVDVASEGAATVSGRAVGLSPSGGLLVDAGGAVPVEILAGDVSVRIRR